MSTHRYTHKDIVRLANSLTTSGRGDKHRESIDRLFNIIEELVHLPNAYSESLVDHATNDFVRNIDRSHLTHGKEKKPQDQFPFNVMYLHDNKNMIGKPIHDQRELDELEESTFVKAYWEVRSIGDAIRCLLQASDLEANPVVLNRLYKDWELDKVAAVLEDKDFAKHIMIKAEDWSLKAEELEKTANALEDLVKKLGESDGPF